MSLWFRCLNCDKQYEADWKFQINLSLELDGPKYLPSHCDKKMNWFLKERSIKEELVKDPSREKEAIHFTARLIAYYRFMESKRQNPLIIDPFAEELAGDLTEYLNNHKHFSRLDYGLVRSYYIEEYLLKSWCLDQSRSQVVMLGAGLDTRAYRFKSFSNRNHTVFEVDFEDVINYKVKILEKKSPLCKIIRVATDITAENFISELEKSGFDCELPTFWILEGLIYYIEKEAVKTLFNNLSIKSTAGSMFFADVCVPVIAEMKFGPFAKYFKWGIDKKDIIPFFSGMNWEISSSYADDFDQGRDVGQKGMIFIVGKNV